MPETPILMQHSLVLAKVETTYNEDAVPTPALDAFLCAEADIRINPNVLERDFYRPSLTPLPIEIGRKLVQVTFRHEVKGSGAAAVRPKLGVLMRGAGFAETQITAGAAPQIGNPQGHYFNSGPAITWGKVTAPSKNYGQYGIRVVAGGASATAKVRVTGNPAQEDDNTILPSEELSSIVMARAGGNPGTTITLVQTDPLIPVITVGGSPGEGDTILLNLFGIRVKHVVGATPTVDSVATALAAAITAKADPRITSAVAATSDITVTLGAQGVYTMTTGTTEIVLGSGGAELTMTWTGDLVLNDKWKVDTYAVGWHYTPVSKDFESLTFYLFYNGMLHRVTGCMGSVSFTAEAGAYAVANFTFTGQYADPDEVPLPTTAIFESTNPRQVELAQLALGGAKRMVAQSYSVDMNVTISPRDSVSHSDGYNGVQYTSRAPQGGVNPEMYYESEQPFWRYMAKAELLRFYSRVGTEQYNQVLFMSNSAQLSGLNYANRNSNRVYDIGLRFSSDSFNGDDEMRIIFV